MKLLTNDLDVIEFLTETILRKIPRKAIVLDETSGDISPQELESIKGTDYGKLPNFLFCLCLLTLSIKGSEPELQISSPLCESKMSSESIKCKYDFGPHAKTERNEVQMRRVLEDL